MYLPLQVQLSRRERWMPTAEPSGCLHILCRAFSALPLHSALVYFTSSIQGFLLLFLQALPCRASKRCRGWSPQAVFQGMGIELSKGSRTRTKQLTFYTIWSRLYVSIFNNVSFLSVFSKFRGFFFKLFPFFLAAENNDGIHIILKWYLIQTELYSVPNKVMLKVCEDWIQEVLGLDFTVKCFILKTQDDLPNEL